MLSTEPGPPIKWLAAVDEAGLADIDFGKDGSGTLGKLLSDYIKAYEGTLAPQRCQALIEKFEGSPALHERKQMEGAYSFVELNVSKHWNDVEAEIAKIFMTCLRQYWHSLNIGTYWPPNPMAEEIRIQRYLPDGRDSFPPHVDVMDDVDSRRFATAILYLNDPGGGETIFPGLDVRIKPVPGRLALFPPLWLFPHAGLHPSREPKYILHSYLLYPYRVDLMDILHRRK